MSGRLLWGALGGLAAPGCLIPPDLEPAGADAGPSSPPVIVSASDPFAIPGPITINRPDNREIVLTATDNDIGDSLFVRLYVDYNRPPLNLPQPFLADCQAPPSNSVIRSIPCPTNALCTTVQPDDTADHVLEAMISDRPFLPDADPDAMTQPLFRAVDDLDRAAWTFQAWLMRCETSAPPK